MADFHRDLWNCVCWHRRVDVTRYKQEDGESDSDEKSDGLQGKDGARKSEEVSMQHQRPTD